MRSGCVRREIVHFRRTAMSFTYKYRFNIGLNNYGSLYKHIYIYISISVDFENKDLGIFRVKILRT